ncbi:hypothetical protein [Mucilaginibacter sp. UR6-11]|uniref:hypothetical protein n=1 Tax=Mucilaginibacter sp. UR6-11 TaxID=1435644 RepID=UPI001E5F4081|nr:hypothetical protein [Mucilaginibacter sp. UR6-11]MCC8424438.1 hypothetical protein [Mucilaginibacter sp. UR6-11]
MTVHFFNNNIPEARFELRWGNEGHKTPSIKLSPGDMASFDLDVFSEIPDGAYCRAYACQVGTDLAKQSSIRFKYVKGRGFGGTFEFCKRLFGLGLTYYRPVNEPELSVYNANR